MCCRDFEGLCHAFDVFHYQCLDRSMYFDEDGDVAHEFYEEVPPLRRGVKATMRRIFTNLTPQVGLIYNVMNIDCCQSVRRLIT